jgi:hypothetical protein
VKARFWPGRATNNLRQHNESVELDPGERNVYVVSKDFSLGPCPSDTTRDGNEPPRGLFRNFERLVQPSITDFAVGLDYRRHFAPGSVNREGG